MLFISSLYRYSNAGELGYPTIQTERRGTLVLLSAYDV
jgi:hypothetical protein